jgi:hypothetical protein
LRFSSGDSGAPLFTAPDSDDEVDIAGMYVGRGYTTTDGVTTYMHMFMDWDDIDTKLDLVDPS